MKILFFSSSLCLVTFLFSCKNTGRHSQSGKKYQFGLHLTTGAKYYFNINGETVSKVSVRDKEVESTNQTDVGLIYEVVSSTADSIQIKLTYDQLHFKLKNKDGEKEIDAANSGHTLDNLENQLAAIKGSTMNITLNKRGEILNITGGKEIADKLLATMNVQDATSQAQIRGQFSKFIGDDFVKDNLASQFKLFPDSAVAVGDTWQMKSMLPAGIQGDAETKYTFDDLSDKQATIVSVSEINNPDGKMSLMGTDVTMNTTGKQEGHFETDVTTGLLMNSQSTTTMEGNFQVMGKEIPVSIKVTRHITGKKM